MSLHVDDQTEVSSIEASHAGELFRLVDLNREHLRRWHPWVDTLHSVGDVDKIILNWHGQFSSGRACFCGIWVEGNLVGMVNYVSIDLTNQWAALSYWLDAGQQGKGLMTACCSAMIAQAFDSWKFNRVTIECATENGRSRAVAERLGFTLEGIIRGIEWLQDRYVDHAMYGLLRGDFTSGKPAASLPIAVP